MVCTFEPIEPVVSQVLSISIGQPTVRRNLPSGVSSKRGNERRMTITAGSTEGSSLPVLRECCSASWVTLDLARRLPSERLSNSIPLAVAAVLKL